MGDIIATIVLCVTFLIMFLLLFRYFLTGFLAKRANKEEDLKAFYGGPFQKIPAGLAQAVLRQFCINEQVAGVFAYTRASSQTREGSPGSRAMAEIARSIDAVAEAGAGQSRWDAGVINALMRDRFDEINLGEENRQPIPNDVRQWEIYKFCEDEGQNALIRQRICDLVDKLCISPLPYGPAYIYKGKMRCRVYPHYNRNLLKSFDKFRGKILSFGR